MAYEIGDRVRLELELTDPTNLDAAVDPGEVTLTLELPDSTTATRTYSAGEVDRQAAGVYTYDYDPPQAGRYHYRFAATGGYRAAVASVFTVLDSLA